MRRFAANPHDRRRGRLVIKVLLALALLAVVPAVVRQVTGSATRPPPAPAEHTAAVDHGNSGGPLVNTWGQLVGMNNPRRPGSGQGFAIPVDTIRAETPEYPSGR